ncbi:hypothetical protein [Sutcliffiella horikoshii]|uniref:hypothetical protein n=1 Tax=Sutcliffiella horikoshii TaxID=79883 RepID=UPI001F1DB817|nr:hypothetical protein [Sutcliffiella horikoshii]MCG1021613.1 hypothetical protein [Sutcliffiella horikoshii]
MSDQKEKLMWLGLYRTRHFVVGGMTILQVNGREVTTGSTKVFVEELNMEKLRFISRVQIPENSDLVLGLKFMISNQVLEFKANILGVQSNVKKRRYTYLVEFVIENDDDRQSILTFVNKIQLANKQKKLRSVTEIAVEVE